MPAAAAVPAPTPNLLFPPRARRRVAMAMAVVFGGGVLAHSLTLLLPLALLLTTPLLVFSNAAVLLAVFDDHRARRLRWWCLGAWALTVALEMAGVATGRVFGPYYYGYTLRGQVAGVPLLIGLNWTILLLGALALAEAHLPLTLSPLVRRSLRPLAAATLLTAFDWVMEPVAVALDYWHWGTWPHIPGQNYAAWFATALALGAGFEALNLRVTTGLARYYFAAQLVFFVLLRLLVS